MIYYGTITFKISLRIPDASNRVFLSNCFLFLSLRLCFACFHLCHSAYFNIHLFYYLGFHSLLNNSPLINILWYVCLFSYLNHLWFLNGVAYNVFGCYRWGCHNYFTDFIYIFVSNEYLKEFHYQRMDEYFSL